MLLALITMLPTEYFIRVVCLILFISAHDLMADWKFSSDITIRVGHYENEYPLEHWFQTVLVLLSFKCNIEQL